MEWTRILFEVLIGVGGFLIGYQTGIKLARNKIQGVIDNIKKGKPAIGA